jgi:hypothetical protein
MKKETVQQLSEATLNQLHVNLIEELEKKLRYPLAQLSPLVKLLQRVNAFTRSQAQILNLNHPRPESSVAQRQLVLTHEILRFLPLPTMQMQQQNAVDGMIFLKHGFNPRQLRVRQDSLYLLLFSTFLRNHQIHT